MHQPMRTSGSHLEVKCDWYRVSDLNGVETEQTLEPSQEEGENLILLLRPDTTLEGTLSI